MPEHAIMEAVIEALEAFVGHCLRGESPDRILERPLADGRIVRVTPIGLMRAQISISAPPPLEKTIIEGAWEYKTQVRALVAALEWDGDDEPENWWRKTKPDLSLQYNENHKES